MADTRFKKGRIAWNKGLKGVHFSPATEFKKGRTAPNKIGTIKICVICTKEYPVRGVRRRTISKYCLKNCKAVSLVGKPGLRKGQEVGAETREKMRKAKLGVRGEAHWNYRGYNNRSERQIAMAQDEYIQWRKSVFERDDYTCQDCGVRGGYLEADHIKPWALFKELRYDMDNGQTLCRPCHQKTESWGGKVRVLERVG